MALIECWECGKTVSDRATACPSCGAPLQEEAREHSAPAPALTARESRWSGAILRTVAVGGVLALLFTCAHQFREPKPEDAWAVEEICEQSQEAARYIAGYSTTPADTARVAGQVIADRRYPSLDDKVIAAVANIVALNLHSSSPSEIADMIRRSPTCTQ